MFQLVITEYKGRMLSAVYEDSKMAEVSLENGSSSSVIGNIYVGRVMNVVKNINAAFVEFQKGVNGYYSLEDNPNSVFLNHKNNSRVCQGDLLLVQAERDPLKTKPAMLSSFIEFSGKYIVLKHNKKGIHVSSKLSDVKLKKAIKETLKPFSSDKYGLIARTNCETLFTEDGFCGEELVSEVEKLLAEYTEVFRIAPTRTAFTMLSGNRPEYLNKVIDARLDELLSIVTDVPAVYQAVRELGDEAVNSKLRFYQDDLLSLNKLYSVDSQICNALKERVWLKSGAYLVIQPTEALTVIDVNTGKFISGRKKEEGFLKVNLEAAEEIGKQLRLRNYSGIIIVDFIDMKNREFNERLMRTLHEIVSKDRVQTAVMDMTRLGLVEITRKKIKKPLHEQLQD